MFSFLKEIFRKNKLKNLIFPLLSFISAVFFVSLITFKIFEDQQTSFYNFESYIDPTNQKNFSKKYKYKIFSGSDELRSLLANNRANGGITSDFEIIPLIKEGLIKKINYHKIYGSKFPSGETKERQSQFLKKFWRKEIWDHFASFDKFLDQGEYLWEYAIPYYVQNRVIIYNVDKFSRPNLKISDNESESGIDFGDDRSTYNIISTLRKKGYKKIAWINSIRDNALLGLYYNNYLKSPNDFQFLDLTLNKENFKISVDRFLDLVEAATGSPLSDIQTNELSSNVLDIITRLLDPSGDLDVALFYNGDALDAYFFEDNFPQLLDREDYKGIKFIRPVDNITMVDATVISSKLSDQESDDFLEEIQRSIYSGFELESKEEIEETLLKRLNLTSKEELFEADIYEQEETLPWLRNFNYINYTPISKAWYSFFWEYYFQGDEEARDIYNNFPDSKENINFATLPVLEGKLNSDLNIYYYLKTHS